MRTTSRVAFPRLDLESGGCLGDENGACLRLRLNNGVAVSSLPDPGDDAILEPAVAASRQ